MSPNPSPQSLQRLVSLVPSITDSLFALGFGDRVVAVTDYCTDPPAALTNMPRVGGVLDPRLDEVIGLQPDLVLVNQEENPRAVVEALQAAGIPIWISYPRTTRAALRSLEELVNLLGAPEVLPRLETLERLLELTEAAKAEPPVSYFCPLWQDDHDPAQPWWMTFNQETYSHDILRAAGGRNCFATRVRRYPLSADLGLTPAEASGTRNTHYPRITLAEICAAAPEVILLPSEPYPYGPAEAEKLMALLPEVPAVQNGQVHLIDGTWIAWPGVRMGRALAELPQFF
jgi:ABC-type Fe3+-hydroxamate transport system substrate-binding protein